MFTVQTAPPVPLRVEQLQDSPLGITIRATGDKEAVFGWAQDYLLAYPSPLYDSQTTVRQVAPHLWECVADRLIVD